jgi:retron-type reverse transcriptase
MGALYKKVSNKRTLRKAASAVLGNASQSTSEKTREEADAYKREFDKNLSSLSRRLAHGSFSFPPARGVAIAKPGKATKRPVVIAPIESRVVQRAILDVLSTQPFVKKVQDKKYNFGGVQNGGVAKAIKRAYESCIKHAYYVRTDIKDFFTKVPKAQMLALVTSETGDAEFNELLTQATNVELANLAELKQHGDIFPLGETGVAQGSCLSPLLCNLLMHDIDGALNSQGMEAVRYIDDVIIFGPNRSQVRKALKLLRTKLAALGLDAYEPPKRSGKTTSSQSAKAAEGETKRGFAFLGCEVVSDAIRPGKKARSSLIEKVQALYNSALASQRHLKIGTSEPLSAKEDPSLLYTLWRVSNTVRAWGGAFSFCTDQRIFQQLDEDVAAEYTSFRKLWQGKLARCTPTERQRLLGMQLLQDAAFDSSFAEMVTSRAGTRTRASTTREASALDRRSQPSRKAPRTTT